MHAAAIADELGIGTILCPRASGVLSALGLCASERRRDTARTVMLSGPRLTGERIADEVRNLVQGAEAGLTDAEPRATYALRYRGQAFELEVEAPTEPRRRPGAPASPASGTRRGSCAESLRPGSKRRARRSSSCRRPPWCCRRAGRPRSTRRGRWWHGGERR